MDSKIIDRHEIHLSETHVKMIVSGWGKEAFENSIVERITYLSDLPADLSANKISKAGGLKIKGYLAYPKDNSKKYPCVKLPFSSVKNDIFIYYISSFIIHNSIQLCPIKHYPKNLS